MIVVWRVRNLETAMVTWSGIDWNEGKVWKLDSTMVFYLERSSVSRKD